MEHIHKTIHTALRQINAAISETLCTETDYPHSFIPVDVANKICREQLITEKELALMLLPLASAFAVAPISQFFVGAVAVDEGNNFYLGANFEFEYTHIGQTLHAEQSAIAHAWSKGANQLSLLAINYPPCGHCRQFINEVNLAADFRILLPNAAEKSLADYLPNAFGPEDLQIRERILGTPPIFGEDPQTLAISTCNGSHAPYSGANSGIALTFSDGEQIAGMYGENAAFNPSLAPLPMALNTRRLQAKSWIGINHALLVEKQALLSQRYNTLQLLRTINKKITLNYEPC